MRNVFITGCGFLGEAAAFLFLEAGWKVTGICASEESSAHFANSGLDVRAADLCDVSALRNIQSTVEKFDLVMHCASSRGGGEEAYRKVYQKGMEAIASAFPSTKLLFTSSTSVYAQTDGSVVEETSIADPQRATGRILLDAEKICLDAGGSVTRLAGLYDATRWVLLKKFLAGEAIIDRGPERWINHIHRKDAARAALHLAQSEAPAGIYNVCDDTPVTQRQVYDVFAARFSRPLPPEGEPDLQRRRGWTSKRISNAKLKATGWSPHFASFRDTLTEIPG
ncbi:MAG: NAD-dependent epimerase/dehydratase family protein [Chthoniobacterales bacterium]